MVDYSGRSVDVAKRRVLIIDDDIELHSFLTMILEGQGYLVFSSLSAAHGLDLLDVLEPDVVLLDATIPGADPLALTGLLTRRAGAPAIVMLADRQPNEADWRLAEEAGVSDIIEKPFEVEDLLGRVGKVTATRKSTPLH